MFDSNSSFYSNRSTHSLQTNKLKKIKDFVKRPFKNICYQLESVDVNSDMNNYTHELQPLMLELKPNSSQGSVELIVKNKHEQMKQSPRTQEHGSRTPHDKIQATAKGGTEASKKTKSKSSRKQKTIIKEVTSSESILGGLKGVIDLCGLLDDPEYDNSSNISIKHIHYSKKNKKCYKENLKVPTYRHKYDTMILATSSPTKVDQALNDTFYESAIDDTMRENSLYKSAIDDTMQENSMYKTAIDDTSQGNSMYITANGRNENGSARGSSKLKQSSAIIPKSESKADSKIKVKPELETFKEEPSFTTSESQSGKIKKEPSHVTSIKHESSSFSPDRNVSGMKQESFVSNGKIKQEPSLVANKTESKIKPERVDKSIYSIGSQKSSGNYGTYIKSERSDAKYVPSERVSVGDRNRSIKTITSSQNKSIKKDPSFNKSKKKIKAEPSSQPIQPIKKEAKRKPKKEIKSDTSSFDASRETVSAQDISELEDSEMKWCKEDPCGIVECCGKLDGSTPCVRFQDSEGKDICYHYKCKSPASSLSTKCFPPVEIPPCLSKCKQCVSVGTEIGIEDIHSDCACHTGDGDKIGDKSESINRKQGSQKLIKGKKSVLDGDVLCNPDYVFPPGGRRQQKFERSKTAMPPIVQQVVGVCTEGHCGGSTFARALSVKYAIAKITLFKEFCIYELSRALDEKPKNTPVVVDELFVTKV